MTPMHRIIRLLAQLTPAELDDLSERIKALRQFGSSVPVGYVVQSDEAFVLGCIGEVFTGLGAPTTILLLQRAVAERVEDGSSFREKVPGLMTFLGKAHPQRVGQRALLMLGLEFLVERINEEMAFDGPILSYKVVMANIHRIPGVLDLAFPDYFAAGRLSWVIDPPGGNVRINPMQSEPDVNSHRDASGVRRFNPMADQ